MPTYRSITLSLISQFDILTIPEYAPPESTSTELPTLVDPHQSLVSVYVPTYPSSQFWLAYSIAPPHPPNALYYFKLFLDGSHVVSWGCGEEDRYKGKTMFGLYKSGKVFDGRRYLEQRVLCFASDGAPESPAEGSASLGPLMEVRVYRSKGRKRIMPEAEQYEGSPLSEHKENQPAKTNSAGISLVNAGLIPYDHQQFYKFALLDPVDHPFSTFRYYFRTWKALEELGVTSPTHTPAPSQSPSRSSSSSSFTPSPHNHLSRSPVSSRPLPTPPTTGNRTSHTINFSSLPTILLPPSPPPAPRLSPVKTDLREHSRTSTTSASTGNLSSTTNKVHNILSPLPRGFEGRRRRTPSPLMLDSPLLSHLEGENIDKKSAKHHPLTLDGPTHTSLMEKLRIHDRDNIAINSLHSDSSAISKFDGKGDSTGEEHTPQRRNGSMRVLKGVINSAVRRKQKG